MKLSIWRWIWTRAVDGGWPLPVIEWAERRFLDAGTVDALRRASYEYSAATADTVPAPSEAWACLAGDGPAADVADDAAMLADLHGEDFWPTSAQRKGWEQ